MLPKGILFDLDDTIIAFEAVANTAWTEVCEMFYKNCGLTSSDNLFQSILKARKWYWSDRERHKAGRQNLCKTRRGIIKLALENIEIFNISLVNEIADTYSKHRLELIRLFPMALETLEYLKEKNVSLALITNGSSEQQRNKIERFHLAKFFNTILIEGELGYGKPDEKVYIMALKKLNLKPDEVWSVGDNLEWDVLGPQQLGIFGIWNDYKNAGSPSTSDIKPDRIINSIAELINH